MKKQIFINGRFLTQAITGVQRYARELVLGFDHMLDAGEIDPQEYEITLLTPSQGVEEFKLTHLQRKSVGRLSGHLWEQFELPTSCRAATLFCPGNIAPTRLFRTSGKTVLTLHDLSFIYFRKAYRWNFTLAYEFLVDIAIRNVDQVITVSEYERQRILKIYPDLEKSIVSIPSGVRADGPPPADTAVARPQSYILFVGSINRIKNLEKLIEALDLIQTDYPIPLKVVGSHSSSIFRQVDLTRARKKVRQVELLGQVNDPQQLRQLYEGATFLAMPSYTESFGFPCLEAMTYGCPVLASDIGGLRNVCGEAALYCNPFSAADIAQKIISLWRHPEKRRHLADLGLAQAKQFTWERTARQTWEVIRTVAG